MKNGKKVLIIGAGDLGRQFVHFITNYSNDIVVGWLDDTKQKGEKVFGKKVFGKVNELDSVKDKVYDYVAIAIGYNHLEFKNELIKKLRDKSIPQYTFIHPTAYVDSSANICEGVFIYPSATVDQRVIIQESTIINNNVVISHDSEIGRATFLSPSVAISGNVMIGNSCFIGTGSIIKDSIKICNNTQLGAGTLLIKDISVPGKYVGGPELRKL